MDYIIGFIPSELLISVEFKFSLIEANYFWLDSKDI